MPADAAPNLGGDVNLMVPGRELVIARVEAIDAGGLDLALLHAPRTSPRMLERQRCFLEFVCAEGIIRLMGRVSPSPARVPADAWGRIRFAVTGHGQLLQRRESVHVDHNAPVWLHLPNRAEPLTVRTAGISAAGLVVDGLDDTVQLGAELDFELRLGPGHPLTAGRCRVVRGPGDAGYGLEFVDLPDEDRDRLATFAHRARERRRLAA